MIVLSSNEVAKLLPMQAAIRLVEKAMIAASNGLATLPLRNAMDLGTPNILGIMPGALEDPACYGTKLISLYPDNPAKGHSSHLGLMVLFDKEFGVPTAIMNAGKLTAIRTAAASAVATRVLSRAGAEVLTVVGTGEQAHIHLEAMRAVRNIRELRVAGRTIDSAKRFADETRKRYGDLTVTSTDSVQEAATGADIIYTVTSSRDTVLHGDWVGEGCHVNAVGASIPSIREIDQEMVLKAALYVDYRPSAFAQAGEIIAALNSGAMTEDHILGEIGEVLQGKAKGRESDDSITLYRSMGIAAQDLICAHHVMIEAGELGIGTDVSIM